MTHREQEGWGRRRDAAAADCKAEGTKGGQATNAGEWVRCIRMNMVKQNDA